jgi:coproporphyrinogen III oxidase-like Fe-S oxidoreductase
MTLDAVSRYTGYAYAYPHKTAYRELRPPIALRDAWAHERKDALFLYLHVPFCEMRCGFCNLFALSRPREEQVSAWLASLRRQARRVRESLGAASFARMAIGGGTPTFIGRGGLEQLFDIAEEMGAAATTASIEVSPGTADADTLACLAEHRVRRVSIGVQSFDDRELRAMGRPERAQATVALERIRAAGFPIVNVDLIYGVTSQSVDSWLASIRTALAFAPEELYLYPLYVRPQTGLSRRITPDDEHRLRLYRAGRDFLLEQGYLQLSMRAFRRVDAPDDGGLNYCCQDDGMVGLGCGARSYTRSLHYSTRYAVDASGVRDIISDYMACDDSAFDVADWGVRLDALEQRRRWAIKSVLRIDGLNWSDYRERFGTHALDDLPQLSELVERALAGFDESALRLTPDGFAASDAIGPWLYSREMTERMV